MDHEAGALHVLLAEKETRITFNVTCLKLYQFERVSWWCLSVVEYVIEFALCFALQSVLLETILKKLRSLKICVRHTSWR